MPSMRAYGCLLDSLERETNCTTERNIICPFNELNLKNFFKKRELMSFLQSASLVTVASLHLCQLVKVPSIDIFQFTIKAFSPFKNFQWCATEMALLFQPCFVVDFVLILLFTQAPPIVSEVNKLFHCIFLNCVEPLVNHTFFLGKHSAAAVLETIIPHITENLRQLEFNYSLLTGFAITKISFNTLTLRVEVQGF